MNKKIVSLLIKKKITLSIAESCTGGLLSSAITSVSGSSKVFSMGLVFLFSKTRLRAVLKVLPWDKSATTVTLMG